MDLEHRFTVPVGVEEAWAHFQDISSVAECFPGASVTEHEGDTFHGSVKVKLGPIALVYNGQGTFTEKDDTAHTFVVDARGKDKRGNGTAGATVRLTMAENNGATDVMVHTDLAITGKPAQFGRGVMQDVSDKLLGQFVACLEQRMAEDDTVGAAASAAAAPAASAAEPVAPAVAAEEAVAAETPEAPAPPPAPVVPAEEVETPAAAAPAAAARPRGSDDALNLGSTVLPILVKSYWKPVLAALVVIGIIIWLIVR
ncbi:MAG: SRPBCC family protein [Nocardioides sp.]